MKTLLLILGTFFSLSSYAQSDKKSLLRFDGFYETDCYTEKGDDEGGQDYLRFYSDNKVITVGTVCEGTASELKSWFNITAEQVSKGEFKIKGRRLFFSSKDKAGIVEYEGRVTTGGQIKLKWKSRINGQKGRERYKFVQIPGLTHHSKCP